jgi:3-oxoacyl-[acyl-carrier protein] reductase
MMNRLSGRRGLVTGAASGIGLAAVERLISEGAQVAMTDARLDGLTDSARSIGHGGPVLMCDVGDEASVADAMAQAVGALGGLDFIVCCAGITRSSPTHLLSLDEWEAQLRVNLTGTFLPIKHAIPHLVNAGTGSIVTIGSVASVVAAGRSCAYDAGKGGVLQLTRAVAVEYADQGIRANCVLPGYVATNLVANSVALHGPMSGRSHSAEGPRTTPPMTRAADPSELASVIAFLVSNDSSFMTGASVPVDGGFTAV